MSFYKSEISSQKPGELSIYNQLIAQQWSKSYRDLELLYKHKPNWFTAYHLGLCFWKIRDSVNAIRYLEKAYQYVQVNLSKPLILNETEKKLLRYEETVCSAPLHPDTLPDGWLSYRIAFNLYTIYLEQDQSVLAGQLNQLYHFQSAKENIHE